MKFYVQFLTCVFSSYQCFPKEIHKVTLESVRTAECTLENIICPVCKSTETVYDQYQDCLFCQNCGEVTE